MIIDSGMDLTYLVSKRIRKHRDRSPLIAIALTGDLGFYFMKTVAKHFNGELDDYHDRIIAAVDEDFVRYFAVAHQSPTARPECVDHETAQRLSDAAAKVGLHLIGEMHFDREGWYSTGPMHTFKHYFNDDLPKLISRRPRQFAKTRMAGGKEIDWPDQSLYDRFSYESPDEDPVGLAHE